MAEPVVAKLRNSGLSHLGLETCLGGLQADPFVAPEICEELAGSVASVGWIVWNCSLPCLFGRYLTDDVRAELVSDPARMYASSARVSGRRSLVSGCSHADTLCFIRLVEENGEVKMLDGMTPDLRIAYVLCEACERIDTWHVGGLRGTGSHDGVLDGIFLPTGNSCSPSEKSRVDGVLGRIRTAATMSAGHAVIADVWGRAILRRSFRGAHLSLAALRGVRQQRIVFGQ